MSSPAGAEGEDDFELSDRCSFSDAQLLPAPEYCAVEILQFQDDHDGRLSDFCNINHGGVDTSKGFWLLGGKSRTSHPKHWLKLPMEQAGTHESIHLELVERGSGRVVEQVVAVPCADLQANYYHFQLKAERLGLKRGCGKSFFLRLLAEPDMVYSHEFRVFAMAPARQLQQQRKRARRAVNAADCPE